MIDEAHAKDFPMVISFEVLMRYTKTNIMYVVILLQSLHNSAARFMLENKMLKKPLDLQKTCRRAYQLWSFVETEPILIRFLHLD